MSGEPREPGMNIFEAPMRYQAALAAETLRQLNAPLLDALAGQREFAESLAAAADQVSQVAARLDELARQHNALTKALHDAVDPYLRHVEWLGDTGSGKSDA
jgi:ABC-type transporter Mla subunit MlaD